MQTLALVTTDGWRPGLAGTSPMLWMIIIAYYATAVFAARSLWASTSPRRPLLLAALLIMLGMIRQLDLHGLITEIGRSWALNTGWYEQRHDVQIPLLIALAGLGFFTLLIGIVRWRRSKRSWMNRVTRACVCALLMLLLARTVSLHRMEDVMEVTLAGLRIADLTELSLLIALMMLMTCRSGARRSDVHVRPQALHPAFSPEP